MDISIIIPTRHRPQNIDRIIAETKGSLGRQFEMVLGIDEDDENYDVERLKKLRYKSHPHPRHALPQQSLQHHVRIL